MSDPRIYERQVAFEYSDALNTLNTLLTPITVANQTYNNRMGAPADTTLVGTLRTLVQQSANDPSLQGKYGDKLLIAGLIRVVKDLEDRVAP